MTKTTITFDVDMDISLEDADKFVEMFRILIKTGSLSGIRGGHVRIHFDGNGVFQGVEHVYWPWRKRKQV